MLHFRVPLQRNDLRGKARLPKEKNFLKGLCIVWNEDMELERAEIPMFPSSNTRRATEWRREREKGKSRIAVQLLRDERRQIVRKYWQGNIFGIFPVRL